MDIIIPLGTGSLLNNLELKFALRAIEKFVPQAGKLFLIGQKPDFLTPQVFHIRANDLHGANKKERNIFRKILEACFDDRVSDDFLFFNDDHFLLKEYSGQNWHGGLMETKLAQKKMSEPYRNTVANTIAVADGMWWDLHCPIVYNKQKFLDTVGILDWSVPWGYCIKSVYGNLNAIEGQEITDMKLGKPYTKQVVYDMIKNRSFFSTGAQVHEGVLQVLNELYPLKSKYEK